MENPILAIVEILFYVILGAGITYLLLRPKLAQVQTNNEKIRNENKALEGINNSLRDENKHLIYLNKELDGKNIDLKLDQAKLEAQKQSLIDQINNLNNNISTIEKQAQEAADLFYNSKMEVAKEKLAYSLEEESLKWQENAASFEVQYNETVNSLMEKYKQLQANVAAMQATNDAAVAAAKRAEEIKNQADFYKLQLSEKDIEEIKMLRNIAPYLRDQEPLNKIIWKVYYEKPTTDLIGRVIGSGVHIGIYKITEISSGKCYVGQSSNLSDRWKQHIKRGVGAEAPTKNKLYPVMYSIGPESFTFEVIEECDRVQLDEREDYWQQFFKAKEFGYSIK